MKKILVCSLFLSIVVFQQAVFGDAPETPETPTGISQSPAKPTGVHNTKPSLKIKALGAGALAFTSYYLLKGIPEAKKMLAAKKTRIKGCIGIANTAIRAVMVCYCGYQLTRL